MIRFSNIARATALAGLVSAGLALSAPAFAADDDAPPQGTLVVHGADFSSPRAVAKLQRQLRRVAMNICAPDAGRALSLTLDQRTCFDTAVKDGLAQIGSRQQQAMRDKVVRLADSRTDGTASN